MKITSVDFYGSKTSRHPGFISFVRIVFDDVFIVHGIKIVSTSEPGKPPLVLMPSREERGRHLDIAHPLTRDFRTELENAVLMLYESRAKRS